jgi:steroid delta-isomerase-like uncharacterized protein
MPDTPAPESIVAAYFDAWNAHDGDAVAAVFAPGGTYEDPSTGGPVPTAGLPGLVAALASAFPDARFERGPAMTSASGIAVEWVMRGHNQGPLGPGLPATGQEVTLRGIDVFEIEAAGIRSVRGYFDQKGLAESAGLMALVQPIEQGSAHYGYAMRVPAGGSRPPGIIALTWIQAANEDEKARIRAHSRQNVQDFLAEPGFISIVTGFTGLRGFTVTAWEDDASMRRALGGHHAAAMRELFGGNFVSAVWTSVWQPTRINRIWVRCPSCASLEDATDDHRSCGRCGAALPDRPAFW